MNEKENESTSHLFLEAKVLLQPLEWSFVTKNELFSFKHFTE